MKVLKTGLVVFMAVLGLTACKQINYKKTKGGVAYKIIPANKSGDSITPGNIIKFNIIRKVDRKGKEDTVLMNTYGKMPQFDEVRPAMGNYADAFSEILTKVKPGDSIYFEQVVDSFYSGQPEMLKTSPFTSGDKLITSMRILQVFKTSAEAQADYEKEYELHKADILKEQADQYAKSLETGLSNYLKDTGYQNQAQKDARIIEDYLRSKNIQAQKTEWGVYIETITPGQGPKPGFGQFVTVNYKGMFLNGNIFDQNKMTVEIGRPGVVFGFMHGLSQLQKGQKARIYIPSILAYGRQGSPPKIQPNENLIFEVEVLDISDTAPVATQPSGDSHEGHGH